MYRLYHTHILESGRADRRRREQEAVALLVREALGEGAEVIHSPEGAPTVKGVDGIYISISHSVDECVLAVSESGPIGVDTETARGQLMRVAHRFLSPEEWSIGHDVATLLQAWTAKEAVFKAALTDGIVLADIILSPSLRGAVVRGKRFVIEYPLLTPERVTAVAWRVPISQ